MKKLILLMAVATSYAFGQGIFVHDNVTTSAKNVPPGAQAPVYTVPYSKVTVCAYPATPADGSPCTNKVSIYNGQELTPGELISNPLTTDSQGRYQFWIAPGIYSYSIETSAGVFVGTLPLTSNAQVGPQGPGGIGCGATNCIVASPAGDQTITQPVNTSLNVVTSGAGGLKHNGSIVVDASPAVSQFISQPTGTNFAINIINGDVYLDGVYYTTISSALAAIPSGGTVRITAGTYMVSSTLTIASNVDIECSPNNKTILMASSSLNAVMVSGTSINHSRISGCVFDGNRSGNANLFGGLALVGSTNNKIIGNHFQNFSGGGIIYLGSGSNFNTIQDNEIDHFGRPLPAAINGNECISLFPGSSAGIQDNDVIHNYCHDGSGGIALYNNGGIAGTSANTSRNRFLHNTVTSMTNDAFLLFSDPTANPRGTLINGNIFSENIARCNGWPAGGTGWDSISCPPGFLQSGSNAGQGVGFNQNSNQADQNQFIGNRGEYNFYEGGDDTPQIFGTVNTSNGALGSCSSNCVQWVSGGTFLTTWKAGQGVDIGGVFMNIASVQSSTVLTLTAAPGSHTNISFSGFSNSRSIWKGNYWNSNGNGAVPGGQGSGMAIQGGYVVSEGNIATNNGYNGFYDQAPAYVTHIGDVSLFNCRLAPCSEFNEQFALNPSHIGVVSDTSSSNYALYWDLGTSHGYAESNSLCSGTTCGISTIQDNGTEDAATNGKVRGTAGTNGATQAQCFAAGGGTGCINGNGNGYVVIPAVGTSGSPATLAVQSGISGTCSAVTVVNGIVTGCTP